MKMARDMKLKGDNRKRSEMPADPGKEKKASVAKAQAPKAGKPSPLAMPKAMKKRER